MYKRQGFPVKFSYDIQQYMGRVLGDAKLSSPGFSRGETVSTRVLVTREFAGTRPPNTREYEIATRIPVTSITKRLFFFSKGYNTTLVRSV